MTAAIYKLKLLFYIKTTMYFCKDSSFVTLPITRSVTGKEENLVSFQINAIIAPPEKKKP